MTVPEKFAAIDLGSNSFHMVVARVDGHEVLPIEHLGEKVQLAGGMQNGKLNQDAMQRGWECLSRFAQRLQGIESGAVRVVGTNALRAAKNGQVFISQAEQILNCPVEIIAGREEARLVYLGVAHTLGDDDDRNRLVIDIGGGSTELIIGQRFEARMMESLHMGCVSYMQRFFNGGRITKFRLEQAQQAAALELLNIRDRYQAKGWSSCVGSSGTIQAVEQVLINQGWSEGGITLKGLQKLKKALLNFEHLEEVRFQGLKENRRSVFASGLAIVMALFETLNLEYMSVSNGALREGVLYDLLGRLDHEDVRERTVTSLEKRYDIDTKQGHRVAELAQMLWRQVAGSWQIQTESFQQLLVWAGRLHEVGMAIAHSQFHKHGEYILSQSDLAGFSKQQQLELAALVRCHRRKFSIDSFAGFGKRQQQLLNMAVLLRLAVLLKHSEGYERIPEVAISVEGDKLTLRFPDEWLASHPLTHADLATEIQYLKKVGMQLILL